MIVACKQMYIVHPDVYRYVDRCTQPYKTDLKTDARVAQVRYCMSTDVHAVGLYTDVNIAEIQTHTVGRQIFQLPASL